MYFARIVAYVGELGYGDTVTRTSPPGSVATGGSVAFSRPGNTHTCTMLSNGDVKCWGANALGMMLLCIV